MGKLIIDSNSDFTIRQSAQLLVIESDERFEFNSLEFVDIFMSASDGVDFILHSQCYSFCQRIENTDCNQSSFHYSYIFKKTSPSQSFSDMSFCN